MSEQANTPAKEAVTPAPRFPARLVLRIAVPVIAALIIVVVVSGSRETRTVSQVIDEIRAIALAKPQGGPIGSWWVSATSVDEADGRLQNFKVECGSIDIAAGSALIVVNHHKNTFQFEMWDVVLARTPDASDPHAEHTLQQLTRYVLGPLPYSREIVGDKDNPTPAAVRAEE